VNRKRRQSRAALILTPPVFDWVCSSVVTLLTSRLFDEPLTSRLFVELLTSRLFVELLTSRLFVDTPWRNGFHNTVGRLTQIARKNGTRIRPDCQ